MQLATLYVQMGQADDALMVLESDPNSEKTDENAASSEMDLFPLQQDEAAEDTIEKEARTKVLNYAFKLKCIEILPLS